MDGWLHCFRNPDKYIDSNMPKDLISESDFCNHNVYKPDKNKKFTIIFIYVLKMVLTMTNVKAGLLKIKTGNLP